MTNRPERAKSHRSFTEPAALPPPLPALTRPKPSSGRSFSASTSSSSAFAAPSASAFLAALRRTFHRARRRRTGAMVLSICEFRTSADSGAGLACSLLFGCPALLRRRSLLPILPSAITGGGGEHPPTQPPSEPTLPPGGLQSLPKEIKRPTDRCQPAARTQESSAQAATPFLHWHRYDTVYGNQVLTNAQLSSATFDAETTALQQRCSRALRPAQPPQIRRAVDAVSFQPIAAL